MSLDKLTMRIPTNLLILVVFLLLGWTCAAEDQGDAAQSIEKTRPPFDTEEIVGPWVSMWNTYDVSMVDSLFLTDSRLTYFSSEKEGLLRGIEAVREHHVGFGFVEGGKNQDNELWLEELQSQSFGEVTTVEGIWYFRSVSGDSSTTSKGPVTFVYVSVENEYRIAHVHFANY